MYIMIFKSFTSFPAVFQKQRTYWYVMVASLNEETLSNGDILLKGKFHF